MRRFILPLALCLAACTPAPLVSPAETATRAIADPSDGADLPPMKTFGASRVPTARVSNRDLAVDFLDLSFELESGRALPVFTRFEGPITVRVTGRPPASMGPDLTKLLHRLRTEAGISIERTNASDASITIEAVSRARIRRALPHAACFVVPNITSLREYGRARRSARTNWTELTRRETLAIFVPNDASPQELRDCLHEELAQAIGPLNDLYRLPDSVFNDDNVHTVLTGFDMLVLRVYYDPALRSGMTRAQVAERLPAILARINPGGQGRPARFAGRTTPAWSQAVQDALGPGATTAERRVAASRAVRISEDLSWNDNRSAFAHYAAGRLEQSSDPARAKAHFLRADEIYARSPDTDLHRAYVATQLAAHAISDGDGALALSLLAPHLDAAARSENAALLATMMMLRAEALDMTGRVSEAQSVRLDSLGWARYGFGPDWAVRAKVREVAALNPITGRG